MESNQAMRRHQIVTYAPESAPALQMNRVEFHPRDLESIFHTATEITGTIIHLDVYVLWSSIAFPRYLTESLGLFALFLIN